MSLTNGIKDDADPQLGGLVGLAKDTALKPYRVAVSKPARRAYLTTFLAVSTGLLLFGLAVIAYVLFYWSYIPRIGFERVVHLQFQDVYSSNDGSPHGIVTLSPDIVGGQRYDVVIELVVPRTPSNLNAGNFMLEATMLAPLEAAGSTIMDTVQAGVAPGSQPSKVLATSHRPAILQYRSFFVELIHQFARLHWYVLGLRQEKEKLRTTMFEGVEFARGWRDVPATMRVEVHSKDRLQVYSAKAQFRARFRGLRWLMYNHRVLSAVVCISAFWTTELLFAGLMWALLSVFITSDKNEQVKAEKLQDETTASIKDEFGEEEELKPVLSDTERTFPTLSTQTPLRYESKNPPPTQIKQEDEEMDADDLVRVPESVRQALDADDEDEDADFFLDSGIGTSMESSGPGRRESIRRRKGRMSASGAEK